MTPTHDNLPLIFRSLSDTTRLRLLNLLSAGEVCVCQLGEVLDLAQPKVSRHLAYLKRAGLVEARREGKWIHYRWRSNLSPIVGNIMDGVRDYLAKDKAMRLERAKIEHKNCG